jgi:hypothetical protein
MAQNVASCGEGATDQAQSCEHWRMPMRVDCKFYESRTYATGDTVRMCRLNLAPEAPWRCPEGCPKFERKLLDGGWTVGTLANTAPEEPPKLDAAALELLEAAAGIINDAGPEIVADVDKDRVKRRIRAQRRRRWWWPFS